MIDYFALALSHGLLLIAALRLLSSDALDQEPEAEPEPELATPPEPAAARRKGRRSA